MFSIKVEAIRYWQAHRLPGLNSEHIHIQNIAEDDVLYAILTARSCKGLLLQHACSMFFSLAVRNKSFFLSFMDNIEERGLRGLRSEITEGLHVLNFAAKKELHTKEQQLQVVLTGILVLMHFFTSDQNRFAHELWQKFIVSKTHNKSAHLPVESDAFVDFIAMVMDLPSIRASRAGMKVSLTSTFYELLLQHLPAHHSDASIHWTNLQR